MINSEGYFRSNLAFLAQLISTLRKNIPQKNREAVYTFFIFFPVAAITSILLN